MRGRAPSCANLHEDVARTFEIGDHSSLLFEVAFFMDVDLPVDRGHERI